MDLRYYQRDAGAAVITHLNKTSTHPLIELPTGTGKSLVIASLSDQIYSGCSSMRILVLAHVKELVAQNAAEFADWAPHIPYGIFSAGLNSRQVHEPIIFGSIQSCARAGHALGHIDLVMVDEAHMIPHSAQGQYRTLLDELRKTNPELRVVGLTATPYRLSSGRLDEGADRLFDRIIYRYPLRQAITDGFLCPLISKRTAMQLDTTGVKIRGGDYVEGDLQRAFDNDSIITEACREIVERGKDRKSWLVFCSGIDHSEHVAEKLRSMGITAAAISSRCTADERDHLIAEFKAGRLQCLTNPNILTTGFNSKNVDMIVMLRPTLSTALYVQMLGRGTRCIGKNIEESIANGKSNCLVLDFAGNVSRHGPVDAIDPPKKGQKSTVRADQQMAKPCRHCGELNALSARVCTDCGEEFPRNDEVRHDAHADSESAVMAAEIEQQWIDVTSMTCQIHTKAGSQPMLMINYYCATNRIRQFVTLLHDGYAGEKARDWWRRMFDDGLDPWDWTGSLPDPDRVIAAMRPVKAIKIKVSGKYMSPVQWMMDDDLTVVDERGRAFAMDG